MFNILTAIVEISNLIEIFLVHYNVCMYIFIKLFAYEIVDGIVFNEYYLVICTHVWFNSKN